jgi:hypothetical protein
MESASPSDNKNGQALSLDWLGLALVFCSLPMLMEGMKELSLNSGKYGWNVIMLSVGALFTCLFIYRSLRIESPYCISSFSSIGVSLYLPY